MGYDRFTKFNLDLIKNLPAAMQAELITFEEVIPIYVAITFDYNGLFLIKPKTIFC
ncbi:hypothetical protein SAMN05216439_0207 [Methanobrevibacter gottschalkii]|uniref:Uncharacterized protein n=1 Tax=Methanobrevibacter gottschalkii TaxID=190974 RepID=A0A1H7NGN1_9EURY|nr:hypothetical protein [Methanobrevibacter gottschalkii]SEL22692.1 hypothetical protein SAMN05216439_0207 [Methanobrevibacter gottschalkii]